MYVYCLYPAMSKSPKQLAYYMQEKFEDTKVVVRSPKSKRNRQPNDKKRQRDKQRYTKYYTED